VGENGDWDGENYPDGIPDCGKPRPSKILQWSVNKQDWIPANHQVHGIGYFNQDPSTQMGVDITFARTLIDSGMSSRVGLVPMAMGGTNMFANWLPAMYGQYQTMIKETVKAMAAAGHTARLRGMMIILGEGDAMYINNFPTTYNPAGMFWSGQFGVLMKNMIETARQDLAPYNSLLPVTIALQAITNRDRVFPFLGVVREQIAALDLPNLVKGDMEGCPMYLVDYSGYNGYLGIWPEVGWQAVHLTRSGACCMGSRLANAYLTGFRNMVNQTV